MFKARNKNLIYLSIQFQQRQCLKNLNINEYTFGIGELAYEKGHEAGSYCDCIQK